MNNTDPLVDDLIANFDADCIFAAEFDCYDINNDSNNDSNNDINNDSNNEIILPPSFSWDIDNDNYIYSASPTTTPRTTTTEDEMRDPTFGIAKAVGLGLGVFSIAVLLSTIPFFLARKNNNSNSSNNNNNNNNNETIRDIEAGTSTSTNATPVSLASKMVMYSEAFDRNKNQIVLKASQILGGENDDDAREDEETGGNRNDCNDDEDASIYLALEGARSLRRSTYLEASIQLVVGEIGNGTSTAAQSDNDDDNDNDKSISLTSKSNKPSSSTRRKSSLVHPRSSKTVKNIVRGNCVICMENMHAGEMVVWSETKSCPHVYHKDCMVAFLAHQRKPNTHNGDELDLDLDRSPCPTCRQNFVTVRRTTCTLLATLPRQQSSETMPSMSE